MLDALCLVAPLLARMVPTSVGAEGLVYVPQHMYQGISTDNFGWRADWRSLWPSPKDAYVSLHPLPGLGYLYARWIWRWYHVNRLACRASGIAAVTLPLPWPVRCGLGLSVQIASRPLISRTSFYSSSTASDDNPSS